MSIASRGYAPAANDWQQQLEVRELNLFVQHLPLLLRRSGTIFKCQDYFFCQPLFAMASYPYLQGDGPLFLGYLLLGFDNGQGPLVGECFQCYGTVFVFSFGGSPLSGHNKWQGFCQGCRLVRTGSWQTFSDKVQAILQLRRRYPFELNQSGSAKPLTFHELIAQLKIAKPLEGNPPNVSLLLPVSGLKLAKDHRNIAIE